MSDSEKNLNEADSTTVAEEPKKEESVGAPSSKVEEKSNGGLTAQLDEKIIRQVEYYFGDRNLPRDKFLQAAIAENDGGWVPIETLLTFNRLKVLSSDSAYIISALRKSGGNILEINNDGASVRRSPDNPPPDIFSPLQRQTMKEKTVYVKGFDETLGLDDIQSFFDQYGKLEHVQMRRNLVEDKKFKGSVFAEFKEKEKAESFLKLPSITFKGKELLKESKEAYYARKSEERKTRKVEQKPSSGTANEPESEAPSRIKTKGAIIFFKGSSLDTTREKLKEVVQEYASVAYIDYQKGDKEGYIRFGEEGGASLALAGLTPEDGNPQLCGAEVELRVLEGDEEEKYWIKALDHRPKNNTRGGRRGGRGGRGGRHGYQGDRKRRNRSDADVPAAKQSKQEPESSGGDGGEKATKKEPVKVEE